MRFLADVVAAARSVVAMVSRPPPPVDYNVWAVDNIVFGTESPLPGPYQPDRFPFFRRILEVSSSEHPANIIAFRKSAQLGGTILAQIIVCGTLDMAPQPILYVHPIDSNAKKWKRNKLSKMVKATKRMEALLQPEGARTGNSAMYWARRDGLGFLQLAGANSPSQLSMDSYPLGFHDDYSKWVKDNGAGDPAMQADSRSKAFQAFGGKMWKIGTPLANPGCRITEVWRQGTRERFHVPCPHCGGEQALEWANMLACLDEDEPNEAHFTCIHCQGRIEQRHRDWMNRRGQWVAENPKAEIVSFYLWAAYSPLETWANIAKAWLRAKGNPEAEQTFLNDTVGEAYETATAAPDWSKLQERAEEAGLPRGVVPAGFFQVTVGCDCQDDRIEYQVIAWGPRLRRVVIDYGIIRHHIGTAAAQEEMTALLERTWPDARGKRRRLDMLAIDGNAWTNDVHGWARKARSSKVMVVRGAKSDTAAPLAHVKHERRPDGKVVKAQRRWFNVGVSGLKAQLYANLKKTDPIELGFIGFTAGLEDEFYRQLTSEVRTPIRARDGSTSWRWVPVKGVAQEGLDTHLYAQAAAIRVGWTNKSDEQWEALRAFWEPVDEALPLLAVLEASPVPAPAADPAIADHAAPDEAGARRAPEASPPPAALPPVFLPPGVPIRPRVLRNSFSLR